MQLSHSFILSTAAIPRLEHAGYNLQNLTANPAVLFGVIVGLLFVAIVALLIRAAILKLVTRMVCGFFPTYGSALSAIFLSGVWVFVIVFVTIIVKGRDAITAYPLQFQLFVLAMSFVLSALTYGTMLEHPKLGPIGAIQGLLVKLIEYAAFFSVFFVIGFVMRLNHLGPPAFSGVFRMAMGQRYKSADEAQREAVRRFPDLGVPGTPFNREFVARYHRYQQTAPAMFNDPEWPLRLAEETSRSVNGR